MSTLRITGGMLGGQRVAVPKGDLRPTQDRVREALFSSLGDRVAGARFLDLYAGSGIVGLEALSRGAAHVCFVERRREWIQRLEAALARMAKEVEGTAECAARDVGAFLRSWRGTSRFDLIFADPPYAPDACQKTLSLLGEADTLQPDGLLIVEQRAGSPEPDHPRWWAVKEKTYGQTQLLSFRPRTPEEEEDDP